MRKKTQYKRRLTQTPIVLVALFVLAHSGTANTDILYVDDDGICEGRKPCYVHPQDAVNHANPGNTIRLYPGIYGSRIGSCSGWADCAASDAISPALIVYKDGLTIEAIDSDPAITIIETTHDGTSTPWAVRDSTDDGVVPISSSAPNAVSIIANEVTLQGLTIRRPFSYLAHDHDTVLIGGLYLGYGIEGEPIGFKGNTVRNCILGSGSMPSRTGVVIWHSTDNTIAHNVIVDPRWAGVMVYDGWSDDELQLYPPSKGNTIVGNTIIDDPKTWSVRQGIFVGARNLFGRTDTWTDNSNTIVKGNDLGFKGTLIAFSFGEKRSSRNCSVAGMWVYKSIDVYDDGETSRCLSMTPDGKL